MHFELTEEQRLIQDSAQRFVADNYGLEQRRTISESQQGFSSDHWQTMADLGWLALPFNEDLGGMGGSAIDAMVLAQVLGSGLVLEPYLSDVTLSGNLLQRLGTPSQQKLLEQLISGDKKIASALCETQARYTLSDVATSATNTDDGIQLRGTKCMVLGGSSADYLIVLARHQGAQRDEDGLSLYIVDSQAAGVSIEECALIDEHRAASISFDTIVPNDAKLNSDNCFAKLLESIDSVLGASCAEAVGIIDRVNQETADYLKTRQQFGQTLGSFQVLQHRFAEMQVAAEEARSLSYKANIMLAMRDNGEASVQATAKTVAAAKAKVFDHGMKIVKDSVQIHGGMGMTDELAIGHYYKRMMVLSMLFGNSDFYRQRYARLNVA